MTKLGSCLAQGARAEASDSAGLPRADSCGSRSSLAVSSACSPRGWPGRCRRPAGAPRVPRCGRVGARRRGAPVRGGRLVERRAARDRGPDPLGRSYFGRVERAHRVRPSGPRHTTRSTGSMGCAVPIIQDRQLHSWPPDRSSSWCRVGSGAEDPSQEDHFCRSGWKHHEDNSDTLAYIGGEHSSAQLTRPDLIER